MSLEKVFYTLAQTPLGEILMTSDGESLTGLYFSKQKHRPTRTPTWKKDPSLPLFKKTHTQVCEYMSQVRTEFDLPTRVITGTPFQQKVWKVLSQISFGTTKSYSEMARAIKAPRSVRAVGSAIGRNPLTLIIPCHRVIGSDGSLRGFAGGLKRKQALLDLERII